MKLAAIDIGTNSTRLLICSLNPMPDTGEVKPVTVGREMEITRLGGGFERTGKINTRQASVTIDVLKKYAELMDKNSVDKYRAVGTRVLRQAKNADWFISEVKKSTGFDVDIISGEEEAELSFTGAVRSVGKEVILDTTDRTMSRGKNVLVLDIGGGSTELILGNVQGSIVFSRSVEDGSVSLTEKFLIREKPTGDDIKKLKNYIDKRFTDATKEINEAGFFCIIGLAGTITTLAAVDLELSEYDRDKIHRNILSVDRIREILIHFCSTGLKGRRDIVGLDPRRADIIIGGTVILIRLMEMLNKDEVLVSESDIMDGIIYSILQFC